MNDGELLWGQLAPLEYLFRKGGQDFSVQSVEPRPVFQGGLFVLLLISGLVGVNQSQSFYSPCRIGGELRAEVGEEGFFRGHSRIRLIGRDCPALISG